MYVGNMAENYMIDNIEYSEAVCDLRRMLAHEREDIVEKLERVENFLKIADATGELLSMIDELKEELERQKEENDTLRQRLEETETRLSELSKLSAGVARKSSQDELLKALRTFVNKSKHKRIEKRMAVKEVVLELVIANNLVLPEDLATTIDSLDDEQPDSKVVNVAGNYNDIHNNDQVNMSDKQKADNGRK